jgi:hypothetical protein
VLTFAARAEAPRICDHGRPDRHLGRALIENGTSSFATASSRRSARRSPCLRTPGRRWQGLTVYPGLIDMGNSAGLEVPTPAQPANARTREEMERWKRRAILRPEIEAADRGRRMRRT